MWPFPGSYLLYSVYRPFSHLLFWQDHEFIQPTCTEPLQEGKCPTTMLQTAEDRQTQPLPPLSLQS